MPFELNFHSIVTTRHSNEAARHSLQDDSLGSVSLALVPFMNFAYIL